MGASEYLTIQLLRCKDSSTLVIFEYSDKIKSKQFSFNFHTKSAKNIKNFI